jgi:hypothetical protein
MLEEVTNVFKHNNIKFPFPNQICKKHIILEKSKQYSIIVHAQINNDFAQ